MKSYTDLSQSKALSKILPIESADMGWNVFVDETTRILPIDDWDLTKDGSDNIKFYHAWSLAVLLKCLSEIKPRVYTPVLFPSEGKWILQFVEYSHGNVCEISYDNPIDACVEMVIKLHELNLL